jgi:hypothetical protein
MDVDVVCEYFILVIELIATVGVLQEYVTGHDPIKRKTIQPQLHPHLIYMQGTVQRGPKVSHIPAATRSER